MFDHRERDQGGRNCARSTDGELREPLRTLHVGSRTTQATTLPATITSTTITTKMAAVPGSTIAWKSCVCGWRPLSRWLRLDRVLDGHEEREGRANSLNHESPRDRRIPRRSSAHAPPRSRRLAIHGLGAEASNFNPASRSGRETGAERLNRTLSARPRGRSAQVRSRPCLPKSCSLGTRNFGYRILTRRR